MSLKSFLVISLIAHSLLFIKLWEPGHKTDSKHVEIKLNTKTTLSEKTLTDRATTKTNTIPTQSPNNQSQSNDFSYYERLILFVQSKAVYPKSALSLRQEGTVVMQLTLSKDGSVLDFELTEKSEFSALNFAALKLAKKIKRYQPFPKELGSRRVFTIPVNYILN